jgi:hypothetical protein
MLRVRVLGRHGQEGGQRDLFVPAASAGSGGESADGFAVVSAVGLHRRMDEGQAPGSVKRRTRS